MKLSATERAEVAHQVGIGEQYLYQCLTGRKAMKPEEAVRVERECGRLLRRWHLRPRDWHRIWPELIGAPGAPDVSELQAAGASTQPAPGAVTAEPSTYGGGHAN